MFNITVIRLKDIIKYPVAFAILMFIIYGATRYFFNDNINKDKVNLGDKLRNSLSQYVLYPINKEFGLIESVNLAEEQLIDENNENADEEFTSYMLNTALNLQFGIIEEKEIDLSSLKIS